MGVRLHGFYLKYANLKEILPQNLMRMFTTETRSHGILNLHKICLIQGNAQGKNQEEGVLGSAKRGLERPYILKPLRYGNPIWISIRPVPLGEEPLYKGKTRFDLGPELE